MTDFEIEKVERELMNPLDNNPAMTDIPKNTISIPLAKLSSIGAGFSELIPGLHVISQTTSINTKGLYMLANANAGDVLKVDKNGNSWGALKTADGASKMAQFKEAGPMSATSTSVMPIDPATLMMAAALYSIDCKLDDISKTSHDILAFIKAEAEAGVEGRVETMQQILMDYKNIWNNDLLIANRLNNVSGIQKQARSDIRNYQKEIDNILKNKQLVVGDSFVKTAKKNLLNSFYYYRLSLYEFSMASMLEILLTQLFEPGHILLIEKEIKDKSMEYRNKYAVASEYIEKLSKASIQNNVIKGIGNASKAVGGFIGSIPVIKEGPVDEFLVDSGRKMKKSVSGIEQKTVKSFAVISNPETAIFINKINELNNIFNHTKEIAFDNENLYLLANNAL